MDAFPLRASNGGNTAPALKRLLQTAMPFAPDGWLDAVRKAHGRYSDGHSNGRQTTRKTTGKMTAVCREEN
jgi:hypothetical protein